MFSAKVNPADTVTATERNNLRKDIVVYAGDYATSGGSANVQTLTLDSQFVLQENSVVKFKAGFSNTGSCTMNVTPSGGGATGAKTIKKHGTVNLAAGDIVSGQVYELIYDGTNFQLPNDAVIDFGDASDGDFHATVDTTLNPSYKVFKYNNFTVDSGKTLTFGSNFQAKPILVLLQGNLVLNGATVDVTGMGYAGGGGAATNSSLHSTGTIGTPGTNSQSQFSKTGGGGGLGGGGTSSNSPGTGAQPATATAGVFGTDFYQYGQLGYKFIFIGSGGGGGGSGGTGEVSSGQTGGAGGGGAKGGGGILFMVRGTVDVTSAVLKADGGTGSNGTAGGNGLGGTSGNGGGGGGGGGGQGGSFRILAKGTITGSPSTFTASGGSPGTGGGGGPSPSGGAGTGSGGGGSGGVGGGQTSQGGTGNSGANGSAPGGSGASGTAGLDGITELTQIGSYQSI